MRVVYIIKGFVYGPAAGVPLAVSEGRGPR